MTSGKESPSTIGILYARTPEVRFVEFNKRSDVTIRIQSDLKANNGNGTVAVYNYAAELWRAYNVYLLADNAIVFTGYNIFKIRSPKKIFQQARSTSTCHRWRIRCFSFFPLWRLFSSEIELLSERGFFGKVKMIETPARKGGGF